MAFNLYRDTDNLKLSEHKTWKAGVRALAEQMIAVGGDGRFSLRTPAGWKDIKIRQRHD